MYQEQRAIFWDVINVKKHISEEAHELLQNYCISETVENKNNVYRDFLLKINDTIISQNIAFSSWDTPVYNFRVLFSRKLYGNKLLKSSPNKLI